MNERAKQALSYLKDHWHVGMTGTADAADFLDINRNTLNTRIKRGQALVLRDAKGDQRTSLTFTGYHLIYNLISDRLLRYGLAVEQEGSTPAELPHVYAEWVFHNVLSTPHHLDSIIRFHKDGNGKVTHFLFEDGRKDGLTRDAALIVPVGEMVRNLAAFVHIRAFPAAYVDASGRAN